MLVSTTAAGFGTTRVAEELFLPGFPKVFQLGSRPVLAIFDGPVEVTEKIDGSQIGFGKVDGVVRLRSHHGPLDPNEGAHDKVFAPAIREVLACQDRLPEGYIFYGETLAAPKHNRIKYGRVPSGHIAVFGVRTPTGEFLSWEEITGELIQNFLPFEPVRSVWSGPCSPNEVLRMLSEQDGYSQLGGPMEGLVVKNLSRECRVGRAVWPISCAKIVNEAFKETAPVRVGRGNAFALLCAKYRSEARWEKACQHLREQGVLEDDPRDIGKLIAEVQRDVVEEEKDSIMGDLWREFSPQILRGTFRGLPEWYKRRLVGTMDERREQDAVDERDCRAAGEIVRALAETEVTS